MLAVLVYYTFPYDWSWVECLLFGAAFSATDPVAVIAVLREVGGHNKGYHGTSATPAHACREARHSASPCFSVFGTLVAANPSPLLRHLVLIESLTESIG